MPSSSSSICTCGWLELSSTIFTSTVTPADSQCAFRVFAIIITVRLLSSIVNFCESVHHWCVQFHLGTVGLFRAVLRSTTRTNLFCSGSRMLYRSFSGSLTDAPSVPFLLTYSLSHTPAAISYSEPSFPSKSARFPPPFLPAFHSSTCSWKLAVIIAKSTVIFLPIVFVTFLTPARPSSFIAKVIKTQPWFTYVGWALSATGSGVTFRRLVIAPVATFISLLLWAPLSVTSLTTLGLGCLILAVALSCLMLQSA